MRIRAVDFYTSQRQRVTIFRSRSAASDVILIARLYGSPDPIGTFSTHPNSSRSFDESMT